MNFFRRHWYNIGLVILPVTIGLAFLLPGLQTLQTILLLNFAALLIHQFEEYGWPGGGPWILNQVMRKSEQPDRYPLNQNNAFFINVVFAWPFYLLPVFYPQVAWLGLAPVLFGFTQFIGHGLAGNIQLKSVYNPGLAAVVLGHIPLGIWYIVEAYLQQIITGSDWLFAVLYMIVFMAIFMQAIGYKLLGPKDSQFPFAPEEMARYDPERRLAKIRE